jgi:galactokinase
MQTPKTFFQCFNSAPEFKSYAHGRVNLIGEHTDYNHGFVLPTAIPQKTMIELNVRNDNRVQVYSANVNDEQIICYELGEEKASSSWVDYVQGVTFVLRREGFNLSGFDAHISSDVPIGGGVSSSAALEVALLRALRDAFHLDLSDVTTAKLAQLAENDFVGSHVGIMDQMSASLGRYGQALFLDTKNLSYIFLDLPFDYIDLIVIDSGISHSHASGEYNSRRQECQEVCTILGVTSLRDLSINDLDALKLKVDDKLFSRAKHVITENFRVVKFVEAMKSENYMQMGELMNESHLSLQLDYEVSIPQIDKLVEICRRESCIYGARMTGGGFGGSIVALAQKDSGFSASQRILKQFQNFMGNQQSRVLVPS